MPKPSDTFRLVVAAAPGGSPTVAPELELTKAALLYADAVTVLSPVTMLLLRVADFSCLDERTQIGLVQRVAPYVMADAEAANVRSGLDAVAPFLSKRRRSRTRADLLLRGLIAQQLAPLRSEVSSIAEGALQGAGFHQFARAQAKGLVKFESCDPGDDLDLIASCVIMAKRAETGQALDEPQTNQLLQTFFRKLSTYLSSGRGYLLCDEPIASLMEAAISEGLVRPAQGPTSRSAQVLGGSGLMARLPTFPDATVDEVLDIRADLADSLTRFRGIMVSSSRAFASKPGDLTFQDELRDIWTEKVQPAISDIETAVRDNRSLLQQAAGVTGTAERACPGLAILATGMAGHLPALSIVGGALTTARPALVAAWHRHVEQREIQARPFYFLYKLNRSL